MSWSQSLIKLATYEVEMLQKRLAEMKLAMLEAEGLAEMSRADTDPMAGMYRVAFMAALRDRKEMARAEIAGVELEEQGARDALAAAFEEQKRYEQVAEQARLLELKELAKRETAAMDELGRGLIHTPYVEGRGGSDTL